MKKGIAVIGAGLVGRRHARAIKHVSSAALVALVDPDPGTANLARELDTAWYASLSALLNSGTADGIVLSTPNQYHVSQALSCIMAGVPVLVEKPLAVDLSGARSIVQASKAASVPVLTGHHRRHNPLVSTAKKLIDEGQLGRITTVQATTWFYKPDDYYDVSWRSQAGGGPVYLNLIHDIDMLRYLCGEVVQVQAMESSCVRGFEVEDTAVILLRFASGALGTLNVSDCTVSPWSWELTARENPAYPVTSELCYQVGGTQGSLALPDLALWQHDELKSWWAPIGAMHLPYAVADPLDRQIEHFVEVICGRQAPLVSARDGMLNQAIIEAVKQSAREQKAVNIDEEYS